MYNKVNKGAIIDADPSSVFSVTVFNYYYLSTKAYTLRYFEAEDFLNTAGQNFQKDSQNYSVIVCLP